MVQEFQVLRCFSCQVFQVHQVKKSKKWACKMCGEKQSLLKVYGQGSGADCRHHVQKLNNLQGQVGWPATGTDGESCQKAISDDDDDVGDETKQSLLVSQEATPMSHWNKFMEDNSDVAREEEEGRISIDHEDYYSHEDCTSSTVRKRKHFGYYGGDVCKEDTEENISKKNKVYEDGNLSETSQISSGGTEDMGCPKQHDKLLSPTLPLQSTSDTSSHMNNLRGHLKEFICSTASCLEREPKIDTVFNHIQHSKKIETDSSGSSSRDVLPNDELPTTSRLSAQISPRGLHRSSPGSADPQSDVILKTSPSASLQKPVFQSHIFQTDEDFDDDY